MNQMILLVLFGLSLTLFACGDGSKNDLVGKRKGLTEGVCYDDLSDTREVVKKEPVIDVIFNKERVFGKTLIGRVSAGDKIRIWAIGLKKTATFSEIYKKNLNFQWNEYKCEYSKHGEDCSYITQTGECPALFRNYLIEAQSFVDFTEKDVLPLMLNIGDKHYPIDEFELHGKEAISAVFRADESMVQESNKLYLNIRPSLDKAKGVQVGFVGIDYDNCPYREKNDFTLVDPTLSALMSSGSRLEFIVDVEIVRSKDKDATNEEALHNSIP